MLYFPIAHNEKEMFLGGLHIPKSISQLKFMQNLGGKQSELWAVGK